MTPSSLPEPPAALTACGRELLPAGTALERLHAAELSGGTLAGDAFNPCRGRPTRFAPLYNSAGDCIPTLYAGDSLDVAAFETVFHDIAMSDPYKSLPSQALADRAHSSLVLAQPLTLVRLFRPELGRWGLDDRAFWRQTSTGYVLARRWASCIHRSFRDVHGLIWRSVRDDRSRAVLLFGDRVPEGALRVTRIRLAAQDEELLPALIAIGDRAGIVVTS